MIRRVEHNPVVIETQSVSRRLMMDDVEELKNESSIWLKDEMKRWRWVVYLDFKGNISRHYHPTLSYLGR